MSRVAIVAPNKAIMKNFPKHGLDNYREFIIKPNSEDKFRMAGLELDKIYYASMDYTLYDIDYMNSTLRGISDIVRYTYYDRNGKIEEIKI